jgi:hypothetical protein
MPGVSAPARRPENAQLLCKLEERIQTKPTTVRAAAHYSAPRNCTPKSWLWAAFCHHGIVFQSCAVTWL